MQPLKRLPRYRNALLLLGMMAGCSGPVIPPEALRPAPVTAPFSSTEVLKEFDTVPDKSYRIGEGDVVTIQVWDRADLSGQQIVGPDGQITLPVAGSLKISGFTREEAAAATKTSLAKFYNEVTVTVRVDQYLSNHIFVLGRVRSPGALQFNGQPTLLEALSRSGGIVQEPTSSLSHCAIIRGRDRMAWIDLRRLLEGGDLSLNINLKPNDLVLVPEWEDQPIHVLGQVAKPGMQRWMPGMTFLDALSRAGGLTIDATPSQILIVRPSEDLQFTVSFSRLLRPENNQNVALRRGDIVYVPMSTLAEFGYVMSKINPWSWIFLARTSN